MKNFTLMNPMNVMMATIMTNHTINHIKVQKDQYTKLNAEYIDWSMFYHNLHFLEKDTKEVFLKKHK